MFKNIALIIFVALPFSLLDAQITFDSSTEVISFLEGEWCPKVTCGGFVSSPCQPIPEESQNERLEFTSIPNSSDSIHVMRYFHDSLVFDQSVYVSFSSNTSEGFWYIDYGWLEYIIVTQYMSTNDSLALEINGSDVSTIIYARNIQTSSHEERVVHEKISVSPNPVKHTLSLDIISNTLIDKVMILDANGRVVSTFYDIGSNVDVSHLKSGMYIIKIVEGNKMYYSNFIKI